MGIVCWEHFADEKEKLDMEYGRMLSRSLFMKSINVQREVPSLSGVNAGLKQKLVNNEGSCHLHK